MSIPTAGYDEFALVADNLAELGIAGPAPLVGARVSAALDGGQQLSAIHWTASESTLPATRQPYLLLHGGGQNAHTWDSVVMALGCPAVAIDLPGHGHSSWRADRDYRPTSNAAAVAAALPGWLQPPSVVVGMSLGGLTALSLAAQFRPLVKAVVLVDVTPSSTARAAELSEAQKGAVALVGGAPSYADFESMAAAAVAASPNRGPAAVRRGVRHNAFEQTDGRWAWRYDRLDGRIADGVQSERLWDEAATLELPVLLVRGGDSGFVTDADEAELARRIPQLRSRQVDGAGHSVQSDRPLELARILDEFITEHEK